MIPIITGMRPADWESVRAIYTEGILTGHATFDTTAPTWEEWDNRHLPNCRLVARVDPNSPIIGWAALSPYSHRQCYAGVAEVSIYIISPARGQGVGKALLTQLISHSENERIWTLQAGIFPENQPSLSLHQTCGFHIAGRRERIGRLAGIWRDVLLLERRSSRMGTTPPGDENDA
jgi:L-amino acid N-acyltransferase YncA